MPLILRGFTELAQEIIEIGRKGKSQIAIRLFAAANALYEAQTGKAAPGSVRRDIRHHDHTPQGGGIVLPRGTIWSSDIGEDTGIGTTWSRDIPVPEMGSWEGLIDRDPMIRPYVTPGIDSALTAMGGNPCAIAGVMLFDVELGLATSVDVRIDNTTTGTPSSSTNIASNGLVWKTFTDIPCRGGTYNDLNIEVYGNGPGPLDRISMYSGLLVETRDESQPQSGGANSHANRLGQANRP